MITPELKGGHEVTRPVAVEGADVGDPYVARRCPGCGVYMGDMHAFQGNGEIAGHTADLAGTLTLQVRVVKGLKLEGPLPFVHDQYGIG